MAAFSRNIKCRAPGKVRVSNSYTPPNPPSPFYIVSSYDPDIFYNFFIDNYLYQNDPASSAPEYQIVNNTVLLEQVCTAYNIPFKVTWTLVGLTTNPPSSPSTPGYYSASADFGTPPTAPPLTFWPFSTYISRNWPNTTDKGADFSSTVGCLTVEGWLAEDNIFSSNNYMSEYGGVEILWLTRQYKISTDPNKGAAWVIRRDVMIDDGGTLYFEGGGQDNTFSFTDYYYFATGKAALPYSAAGNIYIYADSISSNDISAFPISGPSGTPPIDLWWGST